MRLFCCIVKKNILDTILIIKLSVLFFILLSCVFTWVFLIKTDQNYELLVIMLWLVSQNMVKKVKIIFKLYILFYLVFLFILKAKTCKKNCGKMLFKYWSSVKVWSFCPICSSRVNISNKNIHKENKTLQKHIT